MIFFFYQCKPKSSVSRCELHHVKKNCSTVQTITKALIHNSAVKVISQVDKMLTVNIIQEKTNV